MALSYESTRGGQKGVTASQAILKGLAEDGGLFMPTEIPKLDKTLEQLAGMTYQETAYEVMKLFLTDYTEEELKSCIANAYDDKFDTEEITFSKSRRRLFPGALSWKHHCFQGHGSFHPSSSYDYSCKEEPCRQGDRDLNCYLRRYRKSSYGRFC